MLLLLSVFLLLSWETSSTLAEALEQLVKLLEWKIGSALRWRGIAVKFLPLSAGIYRKLFSGALIKTDMTRYHSTRQQHTFNQTAL